MQEQATQETLIQDQPTSEPVTQPTPKPNPRALSALRHGLTGQIHIFTPTDQAAYDKHCQGYHQSLAPVGFLETDLVQSIADDRWRLKRAAALENSIYADGISLPDEAVSGHPEVDTSLAQGRVWLRKDGSLALLSLYENRMQRRFERNMAELRRLQASRQAALDKVVEEYQLLCDLAISNNEVFEESQFPRETLPPNFVFSPPEIVRLVAHRRRLGRARKLAPAPQITPRKAA